MKRQAEIEAHSALEGDSERGRGESEKGM